MTFSSRALSFGRPAVPDQSRWRTAGIVIVCLIAGLAGGLLTAAVHPVAGFALIAGSGVGLGMLLNPNLGLLAFLAAAYLLPFAKIPVRIGFTLTFIDVILTVLLITWIGRLVTRRDLRLSGSPVHPLVVVFLGLMMTSFVLGIEAVGAEVFRLYLKMINSIIFFFTLTLLVQERNQLWMILRWVLWTASAAALIGIVLHVLSPNPAAQLLGLLRVFEYPTGPGVIRYVAGTQMVRATGTSVDPNVFGGMLVMALPPAVAFALAKDGPIRRNIVIPMCLILVVGVLLTMSRGAWLGAVAGFALIATFRYRRLWFIGAFGIALFFLLPQGDQFVDRFQEGVQLRDRATLMRLGEYKDALRLIERYPFFGVGFGAAPEIDIYIGASSIYLMLAQEMGLIGLGGFLLAMGILYWHAIGTYLGAPTGPWSTAILGCLGGVTAALVTGIFDHYYVNLYFPHSIALFWTFVALTVLACRFARRDAADTSAPAA